MTQYPTQALQPGSTGDAVKQLQDFLVQQGYMTQAQVNTGYGIYGPQTTAAVLSLQKALGVDYSSGPGYWGPRTLAAVENTPYNASPSQTTTQTTTQQQRTPTPTPSPTPSPQPINSPTTAQTPKTQGIAYNPALGAYGITQDQWNQMSPTQQASIDIAYNNAKNQYAQNASALTVQDALAAAAKDPNIVNKYADMANISAADLSNNLQQIALNAQITSQQQGQQFTAEQKALKEQYAAAGAAYSGFRQKAQENLNQQEQGIVQSTRSQIQQQLRQATSPIEQQFGSQYMSTLPKAQAGYVNPITGQTENISSPLYGNLAGTVTAQKQQDITNLATQNVQLAKPVPITPINP